jgi:hypothetical protein
MKAQEQGFVGHINCSSATMGRTGNLGCIDKKWFNEGGTAIIVPLEGMAKLWRITYDSGRGTHPGHFVMARLLSRRTKKGDAVC